MVSPSIRGGQWRPPSRCRRRDDGRHAGWLSHTGWVVRRLGGRLPAASASPNTPKKRDVLGTLLLSVLARHRRDRGYRILSDALRYFLEGRKLHPPLRVNRA